MNTIFNMLLLSYFIVTVIVTVLRHFVGRKPRLPKIIDNNIYRLNDECLAYFKSKKENTGKGFLRLDDKYGNIFELYSWDVEKIALYQRRPRGLNEENIPVYSRGDDYVYKVKQALDLGLLQLDQVTIISPDNDTLVAIKQQEYDNLLSIKKEYENALGEIKSISFNEELDNLSTCS